jgi:hypothetical protein
MDGAQFHPWRVGDAGGGLVTGRHRDDFSATRPVLRDAFHKQTNAVRGDLRRPSLVSFKATTRL